jgi:hypothetical protein
MSSANEFLMGGGSPSAKFPTVGTTVGGRITRIGEPMQQLDYATSTPKTWDNGEPMMQLPIDVATDDRDPEITDDDGTRTFYIKGQMRKAIADAVRKSGAKSLALGGTLAVTYARDGVPSKKGFNAPKEYDATYTAPNASAGFLGTEDQVVEPAASAAPVAPASTPAADKAKAINEAKELIAAGLDDATIAATTGVDNKVIAALRNAA